MEGVSSAFAAEAAFLPWLRSLITPCSSTEDLFGNLNGEGESGAAAWEPSLSGLPSFILGIETASGNTSPNETDQSSFLFFKQEQAGNKDYGRRRQTRGWGGEMTGVE